MLPLLQAEEIKHAVVEYLKSTFNFEDKELDQAFEDFLYHKRKGMFKGPYMQLRLPFEKIENEEDLEDLKKHLWVRPSYAPYQHQYEAFQRLSTRNQHISEPVVLTTGTGSGKTESFLFPLLDYCHQHMDKPGIKAIVLYPMNALATDQARRIAEEIYNFSDGEGNYPLRDKIRAGLFIGEGQSAKGVQRPNRMGEDHIIEDRDTIVKSPPDILLTNFKMLDFALLQARFHGLWKHNLARKDLLKFMVLDELHTYDGAKGSDVANLIRRLKLKLDIPQEQIVPVGTSATISGGEEGKTELVNFFSQVFGVEIGTESIIGEKRQEPEEFFNDVLEVPTIDFGKISDCDFLEEDSYQSYMDRQLVFWSYPNLQADVLAEKLKRNDWLYQLVALCGKEIQEVDEVAKKWADKTELSEELSYEDCYKLFGSLLALLTYAKLKSGKRHFPFLYLQVVYWMRSLNRLVRQLQPYPVFQWESDINPNDPVKALPPYFCRECGGSGWVGMKKDLAENFESDLAKTRSNFIGNRQNKNVYFVSSLHERSLTDIYAPDYSWSADPIEGYLHPHSFDIYDRKDSDELFKIHGVRRLNDDHIEKICPHCNSQDSLALIGTGLPTLESIAAAQVLATSTDPTEDSQRKLLAFTNGVQDAAHQAGFIENRNFRFGMRHAIQAVLNRQEEPISLPEAYQLFEDYWKENAHEVKAKSLEAYYYKFLPPDAEARIEIEDYRNKSGMFSAAFEKEFSNRISWELWSEFTYNATIGRTLEKSGASAVTFSPEPLEETYDQIKHWLDSNELGDRVDKEGFLKFVNGFLHRLRMRGGVNHLYLRRFRSVRVSYYQITQGDNRSRFLMKNFGKNTRLPKFITTDRRSNVSTLEKVPIDRQDNWYSEYLKKSFPLIRDQEVELINDFYKQLINYLDANEILDKKVATGFENFGVAPSQIFLSKDSYALACNKCGHQMHTAFEGIELLEGMKCLQYRCAGEYEKDISVGLDYYRMVYNRGRSLRIIAKDHTGLIDRKKREEIEYQFKKQPSFRSVNVLVATSTLEMGIDIGDLNITFNSSLPPETANYLQRVGRAGRSSGTSLILNLAGRDEHDLYYFQDPLDMMEGDIKTPACYLEAKDILRRHFMAFCFDSWTTVDPENHHIPPMIRLLRLKSLKPNDPSFIFNQIAKFIEDHMGPLFDKFATYYEKHLGKDSLSLQVINDDLMSGRLSEQLQRIHTDLLAELKYYESKKRELSKELKKLPESGNERQILKSELKALSGAMYNINHRNVIEHLTNIGILPNYAFPETGINLNAQIRRKKELDGTVEHKYEQFESIVRPASSAIKELAPANTFYSQGYKLESQGLEIRSQDDFEVYRFCSNCDRMMPEVDVPQNENECPECGHWSWAASSNKKTLVRLKAVTSVNDQEKSKITDSSDDRERKFYQRSHHIRLDYKSSGGAHVLKRVPFGIEFFQSVKYFEVNTGIREEGFFSSREIDIAGEKHQQVGFVICKSCGKTTERPLAQWELDKRIRSYHFAYCSNRNELYQGAEDDFFKEIYIYRHFDTEALLVLLPVQEFRSEEKIALFKAGLFLGLKDYFKGRPDHIFITESSGFNKESSRRERYLIFYETIPGGTGYLSRLFDPKEFTEVLQRAYDRIAYCHCKDEEEGKDGCYLCIYTYGNQYEREVLSRAEAEKLFADILEKAGEWNSIESLRNVESFANNEESDLELKFIEALKTALSRETNCCIEPENEKGQKRYKLTLTVEEAEIFYEVWPQNLNSYLQGIKYSTRPDFVFKCIGVNKPGHEWSVDEIDSIKRIAVYLDGYSYHATEEHPRFPADIAIRNDITESDRYYHWTLTWEDFKEDLLRDKDDLGQCFNEGKVKAKFLGKHPMLKNVSEPKELKHENNFSRFLHLLESPLHNLKLEIWSSLILFNCQEEWLAKSCSEAAVDKAIEQKSLGDIGFESKNPKIFSFVDSLKLKDEATISVFIHPMDFQLKGFAQYQEKQSWEQENWNLFWNVYNLTQFHAITCRGQEDEPMTSEKSDENAEVLANFEEALHPIVKHLLSQGIQFNEDLDFDLMQNDEIIASAALGSHKPKFVVNPFDSESEEVFKAHGYKVFDQETFDIEQI